MNIPDLSQPFYFLFATIIVFLVVVGRYFLVAGLFYIFFYKWQPHRWEHRKISKRGYQKSQFIKEVKWSMITALIFSLTGAAAGLMWQKGWLKLYENLNDYPLWWVPVSFVLALLLHETYYYWLHRWMHNPNVFRIVHKVHHDSNITSPWTAFSFHPIEGILQAIFLPLLLVIMPVHLYVLLLQLMFMTLSSVINHLDIEIYPKYFFRYAPFRWLIGATHHSQHHKHFKHNYGLYFTLWDKWKNTEFPMYNSITTPEKKQVLH